MGNRLDDQRAQRACRPHGGVERQRNDRVGRQWHEYLLKYRREVLSRPPSLENSFDHETRPAERSGHIAVWTGSRMLVWGGQNATGLLNNGALYDAVSDQWATLTLTNPPEARIGATAVWTGSRVLVWGGEGAMGVLSNGMQLLCSSGIPTQWVAMTSANAPTARRHHRNLDK